MFTGRNTSSDSRKETGEEKCAFCVGGAVNSFLWERGESLRKIGMYVAWGSWVWTGCSVFVKGESMKLWKGEPSRGRKGGICLLFKAGGKDKLLALSRDTLHLSEMRAGGSVCRVEKGGRRGSTAGAALFIFKRGEWFSYL